MLSKVIREKVDDKDDDETSNVVPLLSINIRWTKMIYDRRTSEISNFDEVKHQTQEAQTKLDGKGV